jgi:hypothetical protein
MSNVPTPLSAPDTSRIARSISDQLKNHQDRPSHLTLMNILARSAGFRNFQHMKASHSARVRLDAHAPTENPDYKMVERALQYYDQAGNLSLWPSRRPVQELCLWVLWADFPKGTFMHERAVSAFLDQLHLFGDSALLRRSLVGLGVVDRKIDGTDYHRLEKRPPADALELIRRVKSRRSKRARQETE